MSQTWQQKTFWQSQTLDQSHTITLHTYIPESMTLQSINYLHLKVSGQDFKIHGHYNKVRGQIKVTR